jgi:hypothetical protein
MTTVHVADALSWLICIGITIVGLRFLLAPQQSAAGFGVPVETQPHTTLAYLSVKAVRDLACGLITLALILAGPPRALGWFMLAAAVIPIGDAVIVLRNRGPKILAYAMHGTTGVVMVIAAGLLLV